jgi:hypothetical protein
LVRRIAISDLERLAQTARTHHVAEMLSQLNLPA